MDQTDFYTKLHRRIAQTAVGASAIRNQGGSGLIKICRNYFEKEIDLKEFFDSLSNQDQYMNLLDRHTDAIVNRFPSTAKSWGAARKGLNLFFRDLCYNKYIADKFEIPSDLKANAEMLKFLEVPLDNDVAKGLIHFFPGQLPKWNRIKNLTKEESDQFQEKANELAFQKNIARIHLDLLFWRDIR